MKLYKREKYLKKIRGFYDADDIIKVVTGVRRCGKSSLMQSIIDELRVAGVDHERIIYIDLDARENRSVKTPYALEKRINELTVPGDFHYLFIDEIQNVNGFEEVINGFRSEGGWSIFITGSNSYLLSGEISTKLTGRYLEFELLPLSFDEYVDMKKYFGKSISSSMEVELRSYILEGGFPRTIYLDSIEDKRTYVQGVVKEIFDKDIRRRVKVKNKDAFDLVRKYIINNFGATTSINSICEELRKNGFAISQATVSKYIRALVDTKILYECDRFDMKSKRMLAGEKKYYLSDLSFYFSQNTDNQINFGPVLENIVYVYARSQDCEVSIGRFGKFECDFIVRNKELEYAYIQVAYTILASKDTEDREYRPLETVKDNYPKFIMTTDFLIQKRNGIKHVNLMEFMCDGQTF